ncbi:MAG: iron-sulfur cluster repair di-iron protein [Bacteroidetes bacterium]|nr:iron-sulfur cluster repair di-iron protein [Bacteroidota bacterium]
METETVLDVTVIEPRLKHPTIFQNFDSLAPGESFIIHNDHDPKPLYYQLLAERGQTFNWEYTEQGPEIWHVRIAKIFTDEAGAESIGEIVAKDYRKAQVFKKYGIDFCCGGKKTVKEVCTKKGIDQSELEQDLLAAEQQTIGTEYDFQKWDIGFLSDYIINTHHQYVKDNTAFISEFAEKVARVHGANHPELIRVADIFGRIGQNLTLHMVKEEKILFPRIKELANYQKVGAVIPADDLGMVSVPIQVMESEHEQAGEDFEEIRALTANYQLPPDACRSYTILFKKLEEYENDLNRHVHLENNILFPKAIQMEKDLS